MLSALVAPFHDPKGILIAKFRQTFPILRKNFPKFFLSITPPTQSAQGEFIKELKDNPIFSLNFNPEKSLAGDHYLNSFRSAVSQSRPNDYLHLCTADRLTFILNTKYKNQFLSDLSWAEKQKNPVLFIRSAKAWKTHSFNYYAAENIATSAGKLLFKKDLDFAWCHLIIKASLLKKVLPLVNQHDLSVLAEIIFLVSERAKIIQKKVDWLSWEDPYVLGVNSLKLKKERENDPEDNEKRFGYVFPILKFLFNKFSSRKHN